MSTYLIGVQSLVKLNSPVEEVNYFLLRRVVVVTFGVKCGDAGSFQVLACGIIPSGMEVFTVLSPFMLPKALCVPLIILREISLSILELHKNRESSQSNMSACLRRGWWHQLLG